MVRGTAVDARPVSEETRIPGGRTATLSVSAPPAPPKRTGDPAEAIHPDLIVTTRPRKRHFLSVAGFSGRSYSLDSKPRSDPLCPNTGSVLSRVRPRNTARCPMAETQSDITRLVMDWSGGDQEAFHRLLPLVYDDLRLIAARHLRRQGSGPTLNATAVVHELYLNMVDQTRASWRDRAHFFAVASKAMRHIIIDYLRRKGAAKRGGDRVQVPLHPNIAMTPDKGPDLLALDEVLDGLEEKDPRLARVVECRFFGGMTAKETAEVLGVGLRTVERDWTRARTYLRQALSPTDRGTETGGERERATT